jgi:hypothetical protein
MSCTFTTYTHNYNFSVCHLSLFCRTHVINMSINLYQDFIIFDDMYIDFFEVTVLMTRILQALMLKVKNESHYKSK